MLHSKNIKELLRWKRMSCITTWIPFWWFRWFDALRRYAVFENNKHKLVDGSYVFVNLSDKGNLSKRISNWNAPYAYACIVGSVHSSLHWRRSISLNYLFTARLHVEKVPNLVIYIGQIRREKLGKHNKTWENIVNCTGKKHQKKNMKRENRKRMHT